MNSSNSLVILPGRSSTVSGHAYPISRAYSPGGRVSLIAYPTGRTIDYQRGGCACNVSSISTSFNGNVVTLMNNLIYRPFGGVSGMSNGAGGIIGSVSDLSGRVTISNPGAVHEKTYGYDNNDNLTSISAPSTPWQSRTYGYDALTRLTHAEGPYGTIDYVYDGVGNRQIKTEGSSTTAYTYYPATNRMHQAVTGAETVDHVFDLNGNITGIGNRTLTYNQDNRLVRAEEGGTVLGEYTYNGLGQRVIKAAGGTTTIFHYDFDGNIIGESDSSGSISKEYLYKGSSRLAMVDVLAGNMYYYGNDKLGTPQILTDSTNTVVWKGVYKPFGEADVNPNSTVVNNFRFPGQYFDAETGLHYNYHRYYDPGTGRYLTPDPIGLAGGLNFFVYVENNPINFVDRFGLRCTYSQSSGRMTCVSDQTGQQYYDETGYSGTAQGRNNSAMQGIPNVGPIPQGTWRWGSPYNSPNIGQNTIPLTPLQGNQCFNTQRDCDTFRAHGNNAQNDASRGCIILPPNRTQIPTGEIVDVVP